jgi:hypothetical protein
MSEENNVGKIVDMPERDPGPKKSFPGAIVILGNSERLMLLVVCAALVSLAAVSAYTIFSSRKANESGK